MACKCIWHVNVYMYVLWLTLINKELQDEIKKLKQELQQRNGVCVCVLMSMITMMCFFVIAKMDIMKDVEIKKNVEIMKLRNENDKLKKQQPEGYKLSESMATNTVPCTCTYS